MNMKILLLVVLLVCFERKFIDGFILVAERNVMRYPVII